MLPILILALGAWSALTSASPLRATLTVGMAAFLAIASTRHRNRKEQESIEIRNYKDLFENGNYIVYTGDRTGRITSINSAAERILGYSKEEIVGRKMDFLVAPESSEVWKQMMETTLRGDLSGVLEIEAYAKDGHSVWFDMNSRLDRQGKQERAIHGIARDVTRRKVAQIAFFQSEQRLRQSFEERERISRDLHDNIIQSIYAVGLGIEDCRQMIQIAPLEAQTRLTQLSASLNNVIRNVRQFIEGIEAKVLQGKEFKTALKSLALTMGESYANRFVINVDPAASGDLSPEETLNLLNISKEAISNSVKYSNPQLITLSLQRVARMIRLTIEDDGCGFERSSVKPGWGLRNMEKRAEEIHGELTITSTPGAGTRITITIPKIYDRKG